MSGKYRTCLAAVISVFLLASLSFASDGLPVSKEKIYVNGYRIGNDWRVELMGLREKAVADLFYNRSSLAQAIKYYERASQKLPNEADIYFRLGNIYRFEKVYNMAAAYYKIASEKYPLPENTGKTQKYRYLSIIYYGYSLEMSRDSGDNHEKAQQVAAWLQDNEKEIRQSYPEVTNDLNNFYRIILGDVTVRVIK